MNLENPQGDARFFGMYEGIVFDRADPTLSGRVRVTIPGLMDNPATAWAYPIGSPGGGSKGSGMKWIPKVGAMVVVWFKLGDPDKPRYLCGSWGSRTKDGNETPGDGKKTTQNIATGATTTEVLSPADAADVHTFETNDFRVYVDERQGKRGLILQHKLTLDFIEYDGESYGWIIKGTSGLVIDVDGLIDIKGAQVQIQGRMVRTTTEKI